VNFNSVTLPLHSGNPPNFLIRRMTKLAGCITKVIIDHKGTLEFMKKLSDPLWFQAFGCVLGFDWNSSGLTTVVMAVLKQSVSIESHGIAIAGGKGKRAKGTLSEIQNICNREFNLSEDRIRNLLYTSKMCAKVDNSAIQDYYSLYHHNIVFDRAGNWSVIQQGMNTDTNTSRRYHWFSKWLKDGYVLHPHSGIIGDANFGNKVLDMTDKISIENQRTSLDVVNDHQNLESLYGSVSQILTRRKDMLIDNWIEEPTITHKPSTVSGFFGFESDLHYTMPRKLDWNLMRNIHEIHPSTYEEFISIPGVGPSTIRGISLIAELVFGAKTSWKDPVKFSFAHGGKDGVPFFIDKKNYDESIMFLQSSIEGAELSREERVTSLKKLSEYNQRMFDHENKDYYTC
jgi:uncharacterized protein